MNELTPQNETLQTTDEGLVLMNVHQAICAVSQNIDFIIKGQRNKMQGFDFRGIDDIYNTLHPLMANAGLFTVPTVLDIKREERTTAKGGLLIYSVLTVKYTVYGPDGSGVETVVIGEAMDSGDKATNKAMSAAHKYALLQIFTVPTLPGSIDDADGDGPPNAAARYITDEQAVTIRDHIEALNIDEPKYLEVLGAQSVDEIPASNLKQAMHLIERKRKAVEK